MILVTGASGYIGQRLCRLLAERGLAVRALYRRPEPPPGLAALAGSGVRLVRADLGDELGAREAAEGADSVIHAAALARDWGRAADFERENVAATLRLLDAAEAAGASEFAFVSSVSVHGFGRHEGSTEEGPYYRLTHPYPASKLAAERAVLARNGRGFRTSSLRLGYVYGPGDTTSTYRMFDAASRGAFGYIGPGLNRTSMVYVDEACEALRLALGNPAVAGQAINVIGDEAVSWRDLSAEVYRALGSARGPKRLPAPLAWAAAGALSAAYAAAGSREGPPLTAFRVRRATIEYVFSNAKARALLGFSPSIGYREGLARAAEAYLGRE